MELFDILSRRTNFRTGANSLLIDDELPDATMLDECLEMIVSSFDNFLCMFSTPTSTSPDTTGFDL
jgi:hypothetical protein